MPRRETDLISRCPPVAHLAIAMADGPMQAWKRNAEHIALYTRWHTWIHTS